MRSEAHFSGGVGVIGCMGRQDRGVWRVMGKEDVLLRESQSLTRTTSGTATLRAVKKRTRSFMFVADGLESMELDGMVRSLQGNV
jgi:hypothetical protein